MNYKKPPQVIRQSLIHWPVDKVFNALTRPEPTPAIWLAESDKPLKEGEIVQWHWKNTETSLQLYIKKVVPNRLVSTLWNDTQTTVNFEFYEVTDTHTLLTFRAYGFKENGMRLYRAMEDKHSLFDIAIKGLKSYAKQQEKHHCPTFQTV